MKMKVTSVLTIPPGVPVGLNKDQQAVRRFLKPHNATKQYSPIAFQLKVGEEFEINKSDVWPGLEHLAVEVKA